MSPSESWEIDGASWFPLEPLDRSAFAGEQFLPLLQGAREAKSQAYAPYSRFRVGAALLMDGMTFSGCNVENASYGATICAERNAIFQGVQQGGRKLQLIALSTDAPAGIDPGSRSPCGMCRQVISEFATDDTLILLDRGEQEGKSPAADVIRFATLFPLPFQLDEPGIDPAVD